MSEENKKPLFIAPVDIKEGDRIYLYFGKPVLIIRGEREVWRHKDITQQIIDVLVTYA